ncbi:15988_t:CDS:2, partial [Racocetra fulgida]
IQNGLQKESIDFVLDDWFDCFLQNQDHNSISSEDKIFLIRQITIEIGQMISFILSLNNPKIDMQSPLKNNVMINTFCEEHTSDLFPEGLQSLFNVTNLPTKEKQQPESAFHAMIFLINTLLQNQLELSFNVFTLIIEWVRDVLEFCNTHEFTSTDTKDHIRQEL